MAFVYLQKTDNSVERRADVMAHTIQKVCFCPVGGLHFIKGRLQTRMLLLLPRVHL